MLHAREQQQLLESTRTTQRQACNGKHKQYMLVLCQIPIVSHTGEHEWQQALLHLEGGTPMHP
jgi:hypothetical protein